MSPLLFSVSQYLNGRSLCFLAATLVFACTTRAEAESVVPAEPTLSVVSGEGQKALPGEFNAKPFDLAVWNAAGTAPLVDVSVTFTVEAGGGLLAGGNDGAVAPTASLTLQTDEDGTVQAYYKQPLNYGMVSQIKASAGGSELTFETSTFTTSEALAQQSAVSGDRSGALKSGTAKKSGSAGVIIIYGKSSVASAGSSSAGAARAAAISVPTGQVILRTPRSNYRVNTSTWAIAAYAGP